MKNEFMQPVGAPLRFRSKTLARLGPVGRLVAHMSGDEPVERAELCRLSAALSEAHWTQLLADTRAHGFAGRLCFHLEGVAGEVPAFVLAAAVAERSHRRRIDARQVDVLDELGPAFAAAGVLAVSVKGVAVHRWLHPGRPFFRGAADIDLLLAEPDRDGAAAAAVLERHGFRGSAVWDAGAGRPRGPPHHLTHVRPAPGLPADVVELHRWASAPFGRPRERLDAYRACILEHRAAGADSGIASLLPTGHLLWLGMNMFNDGAPSLREVSEVATILARHQDAIDWAAIDRVRDRAARALVAAAVDLAVEYYDVPSQTLPRSLRRWATALVSRPLPRRRRIAPLLLAPDAIALLQVWARWEKQSLAAGRARGNSAFEHAVRRPGFLWRRSLEWVRGDLEDHRPR